MERRLSLENVYFWRKFKFNRFKRKNENFKVTQQLRPIQLIALKIPPKHTQIRISFHLHQQCDRVARKENTKNTSLVDDDDDDVRVVLMKMILKHSGIGSAPFCLVESILPPNGASAMPTIPACC